MRDVSDSKWMGLQERSIPWKVVWEIGAEKLTADGMTIKLLTRAITYARMKPPACQKAWEDPSRLGPNLTGIKYGRSSHSLLLLEMKSRG